MRDQQVSRFLETWSGFSRGVISSDKPSEQISLSAILEPDAPRKYWLSPKAAAGILRRAAKRGRTLPEHLQAALQVLASADPDEGEKTTKTSSAEP